MVEITNNPSHQKQAQERLPLVSQSNQDLLGLLSALVSPGQKAEDLAYALLAQVNLDLAQAAQLDLLGKLIERPRKGTEALDATYRLALKNHLSFLRNSGEPEVLINLFKELTLSEINDQTQRDSSRVVFEDWEEHQEPVIGLTLLTSSLQLEADQKAKIRKEIKKSTQTPNGVLLGVVEGSSFRWGTAEGQTTATGLRDQKDQYGVFRLGNQENQYSSTGFTAQLGVPTAGFYGLDENEGAGYQPPQGNVDVSLAWLF